jgi:LysR family transcriptional activator of nhaA
MEWLNYHHLLYFWVVAREGSIVQASEQLFARIGRHLALTEMGHMVFRYADEIFAIGREFMDTVQGRPTDRPLRVRVGTTDVVPKLLAYRLLEPALHLDQPVKMVCREGKLDHLFAELTTYDLDVVLSDAPLGSTVKVRAFNHLLGECGVTFCGIASLIAAYRDDFPNSLDDAPFLLPTDNTTLRRALDHWFEAEGIRPCVMGKFEDSALLKVFGQQGMGLFAVPTIFETEVQQQYGVDLGRVESIRERFYALTVNRRLRHPAVVSM